MFLLRAGTVLFALFIVLSTECVSAHPEVTRHDLSVRLEPAGNFLAAEDALTVRPGGQSSLAFFLSGNATVDKVYAAGEERPFSFTGGILRIALAADLAKQEEISLTVSYRAPFRDRAPDDPVNTEDPTYGVLGTIGTRGTFLSSAARWYPEIEGSRPTFRVLVTGPAGYEAVTAGRLVRRDTACGVTRSEWETREPLAGLSLSAGPYVVREGTSGGTPLFTYFYPETDSLSRTYRDAAGRYLEMYQDLLGPYPFEKFAVVENFFPTGYGFPSYTLLGSTVIRLPFILDTSLGHEVAHSWWGNGVLVDYSRGNWSEGLTTYLADYLYKERSSAEEGREYRLKILRDYAALVSRADDFPLAAFTGRDSPASRAVGYGKAAMVFHMARRLAGDDAFWKGLRRVVREKMFREASWDDFARAIGEESGIDCTPFFRQWVTRDGAPVLSLGGVRAEKVGKEWRVVGRITQETPPFDLRVPLRLVTGEGQNDTVLEVSGTDTTFSLSAKSAPRKLVVDPGTDLFRRLDPAEIPPSVNAVRGSKDLLVIAARGISADALEASMLLLATMGMDDAEVLREEDAPPARLAGHDVLFLGLPEGKGYLPSLPADLSISPRGFAVRGKEYKSAGDSLFVALPHPLDGGRVAAIFLSLSPSAAAKAARKIPHYGKYGYLVFSEGTNVAKGSWDATASPTVHEFSSQSGRGHPPPASRR